MAEWSGMSSSDGKALSGAKMKALMKSMQPINREESIGISFTNNEVERIEDMKKSRQSITEEISGISSSNSEVESLELLDDLIQKKELINNQIFRLLQERQRLDNLKKKSRQSITEEISGISSSNSEVERDGKMSPSNTSQLPTRSCTNALRGDATLPMVPLFDGENDAIGRMKALSYGGTPKSQEQKLLEKPNLHLSIPGALQFLTAFLKHFNLVTIEKCNVGVVIISKSSFTSIHEMVDLVRMVKEAKRRSDFKISPVMLDVSLVQLDDPEMQEHIRKQWDWMDLNILGSIKAADYAAAFEYIRSCACIVNTGLKDIEFLDLVFDRIHGVISAERNTENLRGTTPPISTKDYNTIRSSKIRKVTENSSPRSMMLQPTSVNDPDWSKDLGGERKNKLAVDLDSVEGYVKGERISSHTFQTLPRVPRDSYSSNSIMKAMKALSHGDTLKSQEGLQMTDAVQLQLDAEQDLQDQVEAQQQQRGREGSGYAATGSMSSGAPCGACNFLRRKCVRGCIFAPYFGAEQGAARFAAVHKVFGASNVAKLLFHIPVPRRCDAVLTISYEAQARLSDPVYGCVTTIFALQQQVASLQAELAMVQAQLVHTDKPTHDVLGRNEQTWQEDNSEDRIREIRSKLKSDTPLLLEEGNEILEGSTSGGSDRQAAAHQIHQHQHQHHPAHHHHLHQQHQQIGTMSPGSVVPSSAYMQQQGVKAPLEEQGPNWRRDSSSSTHKDAGEIVKDGSDILRDEISDTIMRDDNLEEANDPHGNIEHDYEAFKDQLYEDIKRIDCIEEIAIDHVDTMTLLHCHDIVILSFFDENEDIFEFYFKNREDMASIVGVGLEYAVVILESGEVTIKEITDDDWKKRWISVETNSREKRKLFKMKMSIPSNAHEGLIHLDVELSYEKPLLWELTKYFSLRESIETFVTMGMFVEYAQGVETSSSTSFKNQGEGSVLKGTWMWITRRFSNGGSQENGNEGSTSYKIEERVMKGSEDTATIVKLQLLREGYELIVGFPGTIKSNLELRFINEGGDGEDEKEVHIKVGTVSFELGRNKENNQLPWYHENLRVVFGLLNGDAKDYGEIKDESFKSLEMRDGKVNTKISSTHGHTTGKESTGKGRLAIKPPWVEVFGEYQQKWSSQDTGTELSERSAEISNDDYTQGGLILKSSVDDFRIVCDYSLPREVPSLGPPSTGHFYDQYVTFQGTWLPIGDERFVEYTLKATRDLCHKDERHQQKYTKKMLVNHSMNHLDGKTYKLRERKQDSKSILTVIGSRSEPGWIEPLVEMKDIPNEVPDATIQNVDQQQTNNRSIHHSSRRNSVFRIFGRDPSTRSANSHRETLTPGQGSQQEVNGSTSNPTRMRR